MAPAKSPEDLAYLMAREDLTDDEVVRLLGYLPPENLPALLESIMAATADAT